MRGERVAVVGAGAVGCYFGGMLARAGMPVTLIGRAHHVDAINRDGLFIERSDFQAHIKVQADTRVEAVRDATVVLLCVKTFDTAERIQRATGINAIPAVVYVAAAMTSPGRVKHNGRGDIVIEQVPRLECLFKGAGIPCRITDNIAAELWTKLVMN